MTSGPGRCRRSPSPSPGRPGRSAPRWSARWSGRAGSTVSWAWPAARSTRRPGAGARPNTGRATSSTGPLSRHSWLRPTWWCISRTSSSARARRAGGYHADNPVPLTEDVPTRGSPEHYYSAQKAACEALLAEVTAGAGLEVYVLRPCIVAGPEATLLVRSLPWRQAAERLPGAARRVLGRPPARPPARAPRPWCVESLPFLPAEMEWVHAARHPMLMDTTKARRGLGWAPAHTAHQTLTAMIEAGRPGR